ncbi:hypothetical protein DENSPDRAFT_929492 [Dentipellis sp. KUC8613]|nr:hypothetical protein DENSPDRAFT_929492 [Dentipellis sp. KUC8613]
MSVFLGNLDFLVDRVVLGSPRWTDDQARKLLKAMRQHLANNPQLRQEEEQLRQEEERLRQEQQLQQEEGQEEERTAEAAHRAALVEEQAERRAEAVLAHIGRPPVSALELAHLILEKPTEQPHFAICEDFALGRAYRGFQSPEGDEDWGGLFSPDTDAREQVILICERSRALTQEDSIEVRLTKRYTLLDLETTGCRWLAGVVNKVEAIVFQHEYNERSRGKGGKAWLGKFRTQQFQQWVRHEPNWAPLALLDPKDLKDDPMHNVARKAFNHSSTAAGRSRTRLCYMYHLELGPAVLLDPTWTTDNVFFHRSKGFPLLLDRLDDYPAPTAGSHMTLLALGRYLGGPVVEHYLADFFTRFPFQPDA